MKNIYLSLLPFVFMIVVSCSTGVNFNKNEIKEEVSNTFTSYINHVNSKGLKGAETYFASDERFYWVEDGQIQYQNWDSLAAGIRQFYPQVESVNMQAYDTKIDIINRNFATLYSEYIEDIILKSGYKFTLDGAMTILMIRGEDGWKFLNGHSSIKKPRGGNQ